MFLVKRFILMIQFLTIIPIPIDLKADSKDYGKGLIFAPVVGLIIGVILYLSYYLIRIFFPLNISVIVTFVLYIVITGGLHFDGLGDTFDGIFSNRPKERILEIMRDSRIGTNALLAVISVFVINVVTLTSFSENSIYTVLLLMPISGRIGSLIGAGSSMYARSGDGLGKSFIDYCGLKEMIVGSVLYLVIFGLILGFSKLFVGIIFIITAFVLVKFLSRKINGATGDVLGAVCELNQTISLLILYLVLK